MRQPLLRLAALQLPPLAGLQLATQMTAKAFGYHAALGQPWLTWQGWHLYRPWDIGRWIWAWGHAQPDVFRLPLLVVWGGVVLGIGLTLRLALRHKREVVTTYGSARWAGARDVRRSGLL